ncbi:hypothetical protein [Leifsonia sp. Leaf264]|uniref:hypothetical protein n=1 Tax=Leifsonia sp. Leaf264 TaxID=1736314 RepID=UPI000700518C|nr:hypothetical protein [Leifsonia sp. Leaf264]KQO98709.1 hypothetical protein ASF30_11645 [Leifsonia sp. Leaf264]
MSELIVSITVKTVIISALVGIVGATIGFSVMAQENTHHSVSQQAGTIRFTEDVKSADMVIGKSIGGKARQAALLTNVSGPKCRVKVWRDVDAGNGKSDLVVDNFSQPGACSASTPIPDTASGRAIILDDVAPNVFSYTSVANRIVTFDDLSVAALGGDAKTGNVVRPVSISQEDWDDKRPQTVTLNVSSNNKELTKYTKNAKFVGQTKFVNYAQAAPNQKYVPPAGTPGLPPDPTPVQIPAITVTRTSSTSSTAYGGLREGIDFAFTGGQCAGGINSVGTVKWTATSPSTGVASKSVAIDAVLGAAASTGTINGVPNGTTGTVTVSLTCGTNKDVTKASTTYVQTLPATVLTVKAGATPEKHVLTWTDVSSLVATYDLVWSSDNGLIASGTPLVSDITAQTYTTSQPSGTTYGATTNYRVVPTVNGRGAGSDTASISNAWPATPTPGTFKWTVVSGTKGSADWAYATSCPAGTTLYNKMYKSLHWPSKSYDATSGVWDDTGWVTTTARANYTPTGQYQDYPFRYSVQAMCKSASTGNTSAVKTVQSPQFDAGYLQPAAPTWAGPATMKQTCRNYYINWPSGCSPKVDGIILKYTTYCPAGSDLYDTYALSIKPSGENTGMVQFNNGDGWEWQKGYAKADRMAEYRDAKYMCTSPWNHSAWSKTTTHFIEVIDP